MAKILIVEDDRALANVLASQLSREGYDVVRASDGIEGYQSAVALRPDLILLDILMPREDGFAMMRRLKSAIGYVPIPVIVLTNLDIDRAVQGIVDTDPTYFMPKTDPLEKVVAKVEELLPKTPPLVE